jgi:hypothetical protein
MAFGTAATSGVGFGLPREDAKIVGSARPDAANRCSRRAAPMQSKIYSRNRRTGKFAKYGLCLIWTYLVDSPRDVKASM